MQHELHPSNTTVTGERYRAGKEFHWLALAILALIFAGIFSIISALARTPALHSLVPPEFFPRALCTHVFFAMITWIAAFALFLWNTHIPHILMAAGTTQSSDDFTSKNKSANTVGALLVLGSIVFIASVGFSGMGEPFANDYVPIIHHPLFWAGFVMMMLALSLGALKVLPVLPRLLHSAEGQLIALSVVFVLCMVITTVMSFVLIPSEAESVKIYFQRVFWVPGHIQQFLNASLMLYGWHYLLRLSRRSTDDTDNDPENDRSANDNSTWLWIANAVLLLPVVPIASGVFTDPLSPTFRLLTTSAYGIGLGVPVLIHTFYLLPRFFAKKSEGANPSRSFLRGVVLCALGLYYLGVIIAFLGMQSDLRITAHYHGVVSALTVTLMGIAYWQFKTEGVVSFNTIARWQPFIYTVGMILLILGLFFAGKLGAPRKTFGAEWSFSDTVLKYLNLMGVGAGLAALGGMIFVLYASRSLWYGKRIGRLSLIPSSLAKLLLLICIITTALSLSSFTLPNEQIFVGKQAANVTMIDAAGKRWELKELLGVKPVIIIPIYTSCPNSCSVVTNGWYEAIQKIDATTAGVGNDRLSQSNESGSSDFFLMTFSFDHTDTPEDLQAFAARWKIDGTRWRVVSADSTSIRTLLASLDFQIELDPSTGDYAHPNIGIVLTPSGKISRYIHGVAPSASDIRSAITEASAERSSTNVVAGFFKTLWSRCFPFNAKAKTYAIDWGFVFELAAGVIVIGGLITSLLWSGIKNILWHTRLRRSGRS